MNQAGAPVRRPLLFAMHNQQLIPDLYRKEYSKMVAVLCSRFGLGFMETAEDIVGDTFLSAAETWGQKGLPAQPVAWLYTVAKNKALNDLKHRQLFNTRIKGDLIHAGAQSMETDIDLSPQNITDSQLQMIFAVCHPSIPPEGQVCLALRILCGFSVDEIARALLTTRGNINKRLFRAKERYRSGNVTIRFPDEADLASRLDTVLVTLYLLFNEGYYSAGSDEILRKDLCLEAMRLVYMLTEHGPTSLPRVYALLALMCFQASRFEARVGPGGDLVLYENQDSSLWDRELINRGNGFFVRASAAGDRSRYHLEAAIAWWHTQQGDTLEKWENILRLYNQLLVIEYSPMAALNRAYAYARVYGNEKAIAEAEGLQLSGNLFYHSLLGELYTGIDGGAAIRHLEKALTLAGAPPERCVLTAKLAALKQSSGQ